MDPRVACRWMVPCRHTCMISGGVSREEWGSVSRRRDSTAGMADSGAESGAHQSHLAKVGLEGSLRLRRHCRWERNTLTSRKRHGRTYSNLNGVTSHINVLSAS